MNKVLEYESAPPPTPTHNSSIVQGSKEDKERVPQFHQILADFQKKAANMLNCEDVLFTLLDQPSSEVIQFTLKSL